MRRTYISFRPLQQAKRASILLKHALRNAAIPVVAIAAVQLGFMLGGSVIIETVFALKERDVAAPLARAFYAKDAGHPDAEAILGLLRAAEPGFALSADEQLDRSEALINAT